MSLFEAAKTTKAAPKTTSKKPTKEEIALEGIDNLATLDVAIEALQAKRSEIEAELKGAAIEIFARKGEELGRKPDSFRGIDNKSSASVELRKRSSTSVLSVEEQDMLRSAKVPFVHDVIIPECYVINPDYANDKKLMDKVSAALEKVPGLPSNFIQFQEEKSREIVSDETVNTVFARKAADDLLSVVTVTALKPTAGNTDVTNAFAVAKKLLGVK